MVNGPKVDKIIELLAEDTATLGQDLFALNTDGGPEDAPLQGTAPVLLTMSVANSQD